jgi:hypothetical protein
VASPLAWSPTAHREQLLGQVRAAAVRLSSLVNAAHNADGATARD